MTPPPKLPEGQTTPSRESHQDTSKIQASADVEPEAANSSDDNLSVFTASEAVGALAAVHRFAWPFLQNYRMGLVCIGIGLVVETLYNVIMPLSLKYLIDDALGEKNLIALYVILGALAVGGIVASIIAVWYERWDARTTSSVITDIRLKMFDRIQDLSAAFHARTARGAILARFSVDMAAFEGAIKNAANGALLPLLELVAGFALMFWLNWQMAAVALLIFPIALIGPRLITPWAVAWNYRQKVNEAAILSVVQENIAAQAVVKAFGLQRRSLGWFSLRNDDARRTISSATFLSKMVERTVTISMLFLHLVVLSIGSYLAINGRLSIGTFVTFEASFWEVSYNIARLMQFAPVAIQAAAATHHIQELLDEPENGSNPSEGLNLQRVSQNITFENVSFQYADGDQPVLNDLNFTIEAGKKVAIVGSSGSGKSTLISLILQLYTPTDGSITIDGIDIRELDRDSLRRCLGVVFQENMLFNMSVRENIRLGKANASEEEVVEAARNAEIHSYIMSLSNGYDTVVGERGDTFSGGQRQRIAIARAIVRDPSILLLDEATSALDHSTEAAINSTLQKIAERRTVICSTHRLTAVVELDEIFVISEGRLVERGSHTRLLAAGQAYAKLWEDQTRKPKISDERGIGFRSISDGM